MPRETKEQMRSRMQAEIDHLIERNTILYHDNRRLTEDRMAIEARVGHIEKLLSTTERLLESAVKALDATSHAIRR